jgi:hypothetical protein
VFATACHWILLSATLIQSKASRCIYFKINVNIILPSRLGIARDLKSFPTKSFVCNFHQSRARYMTRPTHPPNLVKSTNHEAPHYAVFFRLCYLNLLLSLVLSPVCCSKIPSVYIISSM